MALVVPPDERDGYLVKQLIADYLVVGRRHLMRSSYGEVQQLFVRVHRSTPFTAPLVER